MCWFQIATLSAFACLIVLTPASLRLIYCVSLSTCNSSNSSSLYYFLNTTVIDLIHIWFLLFSFCIHLSWFLCCLNPRSHDRSIQDFSSLYTDFRHSLFLHSTNNTSIKAIHIRRIIDDMIQSNTIKLHSRSTTSFLTCFVQQIFLQWKKFSWDFRSALKTSSKSTFDICSGKGNRCNT